MEQVNEAAVSQQPSPGGKRLQKKRSGKPLLFAAILCAALAAAYLGICAYATAQTVFFPGSTINALDVAGSTPAEAQLLLEQELPAQRIFLRNADGGELLAELTLAELGFSPEAAADWAADSMARQRSVGFFRGGLLYLGGLTGLSPSGSLYDCGLSDAQYRRASEALTAQLRTDPVHAAYALNDDAISFTGPADGQVLDAAEVADALRDAVNTAEGPRDAIVSFHVLPAQTLTAQEIYDALAGAPQNAGYDRELDTITPEKAGVQFEVSSAQKAMDAAAPGCTIAFSAQITYPEITAEALQSVLFRDVLGEYTTKVSGTTGRRGNVRLSAAAINGYVMNSGDVFSYNDAVGQRTAANGYQPAPAYVKGETVDEIGGGICQTSSTLYYACLLANLEITERYAHRYAPGYVPLGMDATVSWGGPDYKFTNNSAYPLRIETTYQNDQLTIRLLGTKTDDSYARMTSEYLGKTEWTTVYQEDSSVAPGTQTVKTTPYTGHKVRTYHTIYAADGTVLDSHYEATSDYKVRNKVILVAPGELPGAAPSAAAPSAPADTTGSSVSSGDPGESSISIPDAPPEDPAEEAPLIPME